MATPITPREYDVGDGVRTTSQFKVNGVLTDPTSVTIKVKTPAGTVTTKSYPADPEVVRTGLGAFSYTFILTTAGSWWYRWEGAGAVIGAAERRFQVRASEF